MRAIAWVALVLLGTGGCVCQPPRGADDEVYISGGAFTMGHDARAIKDVCEGSTVPTPIGNTGQCNSFAPRHVVVLDPYFIDKMEVTNGQYRACVEAGFCTAPDFTGSGSEPKIQDRYEDGGYSDYPMIEIQWAQAQRYCQWRGRRLPTEAEWERAARGTTERDYPWGKEAPTCERLPEACPPLQFTGWRLDRMRPVGSTPADVTPEGVLDLTGNANELVADIFDPNYYRVSPSQNPNGAPVPANLPADTSQQRVVRGGWFDFAPADWPMEQANPLWARMEFSARHGFRCARSPTQAGVIPKYQAIAWRNLP